MHFYFTFRTDAHILWWNGERERELASECEIYYVQISIYTIDMDVSLRISACVSVQFFDCFIRWFFVCFISHLLCCFWYCCCCYCCFFGVCMKNFLFLIRWMCVRVSFQMWINIRMATNDFLMRWISTRITLPFLHSFSFLLPLRVYVCMYVHT